MRFDDCVKGEHLGAREEPEGEERAMSKELRDFLRQRIASGYYERPEVIDALARAMLSQGDVTRMA